MLRTCALLALIAAATAAADEVAAASAGRQKYAVISATMLRGGSKNVRWETRVAAEDANGKPLPKPTDGGSAPCTDMNGHERKHGEEWERANGRFKYRCANGREEVAACVGSERTKKARIEVGATLNVDNFWHKCEAAENGSTIYTQENSCRDASGKEAKIGAEFNVANLRFACADGAYKVVGCAYKDASGAAASLGGGEHKEEGAKTHSCEEKDGTMQFSTKGGSAACTRRGKQYAEGETFAENHLKYACKDGMVDITGCYIKENQDLEIGKDSAVEGTLHRCYRLGSAVEYSEAPCSGASCSPPPIEDVPNAVPALGRGLKAPGVASFSIVSSGGSPQSVKLDFDKVKMAMQQP